MAQAQIKARGQITPNAFGGRWRNANRNRWRFDPDIAFKDGARFKDWDIADPLANSIYGRNSIFDACAPSDVWGLQVETNGLMNWVGWRPTTYASRQVNFIQWWGPAGTSAGNPVTLAKGPCEDPDTWQYGTCGYTLCHESFYMLGGETLDPQTLSLGNRCETTPRYRLNGVLIQDDMEWQANGIENVLAQAVNYGLVHGSHVNSYEMNGLESLIKGGYTDKDGQACPAVDSILVNWGNDDLDGAVNGFGNWFDYLDEIIDEIEYRAQHMGGIAEVDMAIWTQRFMAKAILNKFACYNVCGALTYDGSDPAFRRDILAYRQSLNGGPLFDGRNAVGFITVKGGRRIPIMVHDTFTIGQSGTNYCADIYLLTRRIGNGDVLYGQYMDFRIAARAYARQMRRMKIHSDAAGRFLMTHFEETFCTQLVMATSPEYYLSAPWAQVRFYNVCADKARRPITGDPYQTTYHFTQGALYPAIAYDPTCTED